MVLDKSIYSDEEYWNGDYPWGYKMSGGYKQTETEPILFPGDELPSNPVQRVIWSKIDNPVSNPILNNAKILEVGAARASLSKLAKRYFPSITYDVIDISTIWAADHEPTVDNYINEDIVTVAQWTGQQSIKNNAYNVILSCKTLECLTDAELAIVIPKLNNWCEHLQFHLVVDPSLFNQAVIDANAYNGKTLAEWAQMGFKAGTILRDTSGNQVTV